MPVGVPGFAKPGTAWSKFGFLVLPPGTFARVAARGPRFSPGSTFSAATGRRLPVVATVLPPGTFARVAARGSPVFTRQHVLGGNRTEVACRCNSAPTASFACLVET